MSAAAAYASPLRAERGGLAPANLPDLPRPRMTPAEIPLTLSADVLRLPYQPAVRLVLAEIVSLYAANGGLCDASDKHFADRLTISTDTASRAVQQLEAEGLLTKTVLRLPTGFYRTLVPDAAAITAKAEANPYPQNAGSTPQSAGRGATRKMLVGYPQNAATPTRKMPVALPADCGSNIPVNTPSTFQVNSITTPFGRGDDAQGPEVVVELPPAEALAGQQVASPEAERPAPAPKKKVAAKKKAPAKPKRASRPEVTFLESELASYEAFEAAFAGTDYELADLRYYHEKVKNWRQKGEPPLRKDWLATSKQFFLNDAADNRLKLAPGVQHAASHAEPVAGGAGATGYRSSRWDA